MMKKKYVVVCHGCGHIREEETEFLSVSSGWSFKLSDNAQLVIPALGCANCLAIPGTIKKAYDNGPSTESRETFEKEMPNWVGKITS